jgi:hypothetical protein
MLHMPCNRVDSHELFQILLILQDVLRIYGARRGRGSDRLQPVTLQLPYRQTLTEIAVEKNSTIIFPLPVDMIKILLNGMAETPSSDRAGHTAQQKPEIAGGAMLFLVWYDDTKTPVADKIRAASAAYVERFRTRPSLVLVNVVDHIELEGVQVRHERTVQPNTFWVGREDSTDLPLT